ITDGTPEATPPVLVTVNCTSVEFEPCTTMPKSCDDGASVNCAEAMPVPSSAEVAFSRPAEADSDAILAPTVVGRKCTVTTHEPPPGSVLPLQASLAITNCDLSVPASPTASTGEVPPPALETVKSTSVELVLMTTEP